MVSAKNPVTDIDPPFIKCLNQVISNTLEQALIFSSFFLYWLNFVASNDSSDAGTQTVREGLLFPFLFLTGRVVFALLYLVGSALKFTPLRAMGFMITIITNLTLLAECLTSIPVLTRYFGW